MNTKAPHRIAYLTGICFVTTIGGFLFGYDTAVISGGEKMIQARFQLSDDAIGFTVASAILGCIIGSACSGILTDRFGRKPVLMLSSMLLLGSALGSVVPRMVEQLIAARLIGGLGVGITAMASPMYMSEVSPARFRGRMVSLYQLAITLGIVCSFSVNALLLTYANHSTGQIETGFVRWVLVDEVWRAMFGVEAIPALSYLVLLAWIPESPRWLIAHGRTSKARQMMMRVMSASEVDESVRDIEKTLEQESNSISELFHRGFRHALLLGVALALFSQFSGINAVMYYGPRILESVGFAVGGAMGGAILIGVINSAFTGLAIWKIDTFGRRPLLLAGAIGASLSLFACAFAFSAADVPDWAKLAPLLAFCACFSFSFGPVCWVVIGEIFPTRIRGRAVAVATATVWIGAYVVSQLVPRMLADLGTPGTFSVFGSITFGAVMFVWWALPETKGRTLEEIERRWLES